MARRRADAETAIRPVVSTTGVPASGGDAAGAVYQIKVTMVGTKPPVWRRIVVADCTLAGLHAHIQAAMGWADCHLHHFRVGRRLYGDPRLLADTFEDLGYEDSTASRLSDLVPGAGAKKLTFEYEYDFGDSWTHTVVVEAVGPAEAGGTAPGCVAGKRACPPEDVGGPWGYAEFVAAMADPGHERHREVMDWHGGPFDPDEFDPADATRQMRRLRPGRRRSPRQPG